MNEPDNNPLSPTVSKILSEYFDVLLEDEGIDSAAAKRLDALLQTGRVPKLDDLDAALFPPSQEGKS